MEKRAGLVYGVLRYLPAHFTTERYPRSSRIREAARYITEGLVDLIIIAPRSYLRGHAP